MDTSSKGAAAPPGKPPSKLRAILGGGNAGAGDHVTILSGTAQNIVGLGVFVLASFGMNVLIARALGAQGLGVVTLGTQFAFIAGAATRFGMDMAATRRVAIDFGKGDTRRIRSVVRLAVAIAAIVSAVVAILVFGAAPALASLFGNVPAAVFMAAAFALPFVALTQVFAAASRGLKIMRHTLYAYWIGQSVSWIVFSLIGWKLFDKSAAVTVYAYGASWMFGTLVGWFFWRRETAKFPENDPAEPGETQALIRYGAPRAPAALLSQALFWTDYFVLAIYATDKQLGVYAAAVRVAQTLVLFLTAVSYMFSPFVADLYEKGETKRLDGLFKSVTRWTFAATLPLLALLLVEPGPALLIFGGSFESGTTALRILLIGQIINVSVGAAGFVLIMVKRTGWDLAVYASSFVLDIAMSFLLIGAFGMGTTGAAIAQTVTIAFSNAFRLYLVYRFVGIHPYNRHYFKLLIPFGVALAVMAGVHVFTGSMAWPVDLLITGVIGTAAYGAVLLAFCLTPTEKAAAKRLLARGRPPQPAT